MPNPIKLIMSVLSNSKMTQFGKISPLKRFSFHLFNWIWWDYQLIGNMVHWAKIFFAERKQISKEKQCLENIFSFAPGDDAFTVVEVKSG